MQGSQVLYKVGEYELSQKLENTNSTERTYEVFKASKMVSGVRTFFMCYKFSRTKLKDRNLSECLNSYFSELLPRIKKQNSQYVQEPTTVPSTNSFYVFYPFCGDNSLATRFGSQSAKISEGEFVCYLMQALLGLYDLHQIKVLHRKIKPSNLFLDSPDAQGLYRLKIGDSCWFPPSRSDYFKARHSDLHLAPEVLTDANSTKYFPASASVWSIGYLAYFLLVGKGMNIPDYYEFAEKNQVNRYLNVLPQQTGQKVDLRNRRLPAAGQDHIGDFIKRTLVSDPNRRMSLGELFSHQLFQNFVSRYPNGFSSNSQAVIQRFGLAREYFQRQPLNDLEDFVVMPPGEPQPQQIFNDDFQSNPDDQDDPFGGEDNGGLMQPSIFLTKQISSSEQMLGFKKSLLETYAKTAQNLANPPFSHTEDRSLEFLLQKIGIVIGMKGSFECAAYLHQLDEVQQRSPVPAGPSDPLDIQNIEQIKNSIHKIEEECRSVVQQANELLANDSHLYAKECIVLAASPFPLENQIDELLHGLLREYSREVKAMRDELERQSHRKHLATAFLLVDPSTELEFRSSRGEDDLLDGDQPANFSLDSEVITPSDKLVDRLLLKFNSILLFNKY